MMCDLEQTLIATCSKDEGCLLLPTIPLLIAIVNMIVAHFVVNIGHHRQRHGDLQSLLRMFSTHTSL